MPEWWLILCVHILCVFRRCLLQWLEQDTTCPTCRQSLSDAILGTELEEHHRANNGDDPGDMTGGRLTRGQLLW